MAAKTKSKSKARIPNRKSRKYVYFFGNGKADGNRQMKDLLGGKGAGLAEMTRIGLPVPAGFTISTEACDYFYKNGKKYPGELKKQVADTILARLTAGSDAALGFGNVEQCIDHRQHSIAFFDCSCGQAELSVRGT